MLSLIEAAEAPDYPAEIVAVISNRADAAGLSRAAAAGIATAALDHRAFPDRPSFDAELDRLLRAHGAEIVVLAGFLRILTDGFVRAWEGRMINIHPSLLPAYKGLHTHERALADGATQHGCTVHHVVAELDSGPIIAQAAVPVLPGDTPETLGRRVLAEEHRLFPAALADLARTLPGAEPAS
ncbi:MAG: phosphoribosylglycinamide formyltransferase [Enterovirga sp.]|nr:phosphoribosylglycinamide formyltransferase [Enterovirga sp.]